MPNVKKRTRYISADTTKRKVRWAVQPPPTLIQEQVFFTIVQNAPWEWDTVAPRRTDSLRKAETVYGMTWRALYRRGYRCCRVNLGGYTPSKEKPPVGGKAWIKARYPEPPEAE